MASSRVAVALRTGRRSVTTAAALGLRPRGSVTTVRVGGPPASAAASPASPGVDVVASAARHIRGLDGDLAALAAAISEAAKACTGGSGWSTVDSAHLRRAVVLQLLHEDRRGVDGEADVAHLRAIAAALVRLGERDARVLDAWALRLSRALAGIAATRTTTTQHLLEATVAALGAWRGLDEASVAGGTDAAVGPLAQGSPEWRLAQTVSLPPALPSRAMRATRQRFALHGSVALLAKLQPGLRLERDAAPSSAAAAALGFDSGAIPVGAWKVWTASGNVSQLVRLAVARSAQRRDALAAGGAASLLPHQRAMLAADAAALASSVGVARHAGLQTAPITSPWSATGASAASFAQLLHRSAAALFAGVEAHRKSGSGGTAAAHAQPALLAAAWQDAVAAAITTLRHEVEVLTAEVARAGEAHAPPPMPVLPASIARALPALMAAAAAATPAATASCTTAAWWLETSESLLHLAWLVQGLCDAASASGGRDESAYAGRQLVHATAIAAAHGVQCMTLYSDGSSGSGRVAAELRAVRSCLRLERGLAAAGLPLLPARGMAAAGWHAADAAVATRFVRAMVDAAVDEGAPAGSPSASAVSGGQPRNKASRVWCQALHDGVLNTPWRSIRLSLLAAAGAALGTPLVSSIDAGPVRASKKARPAAASSLLLGVTAQASDVAEAGATPLATSPLQPTAASSTVTSLAALMAASPSSATWRDAWSGAANGLTASELVAISCVLAGPAMDWAHELARVASAGGNAGAALPFAVSLHITRLSAAADTMAELADAKLRGLWLSPDESTAAAAASDAAEAVLIALGDDTGDAAVAELLPSREEPAAVTSSPASTPPLRTEAARVATAFHAAEGDLATTGKLSAASREAIASLLRERPYEGMRALLRLAAPSAAVARRATPAASLPLDASGTAFVDSVSPTLADALPPAGSYSRFSPAEAQATADAVIAAAARSATAQPGSAIDPVLRAQPRRAGTAVHRRAFSTSMARSPPTEPAAADGDPRPRPAVSRPGRLTTALRLAYATGAWSIHGAENRPPATTAPRAVAGSGSDSESEGFAQTAAARWDGAQGVGSDSEGESEGPAPLQ